MAKVDQPGLGSIRCTGQARSGKELSEGRVNGRATEAPAPQRDKQMLIVRSELGTLDQVIFKGNACGGVKRHETTFTELRLTDYEPIRGDVLKTEPQRLRNA
jgi:hypothetical protein